MAVRRFVFNTYLVKAAFAGAAVAVFNKQLIPQARCDFSEFSNSNAIASAIAAKQDPYDVVDEDEELEWDSKRETCGFCKMFLDSPCRMNFQRWSKCVDRNKTDGTDYISARSTRR
jgi:hypothetical protein